MSSFNTLYPANTNTSTINTDDKVAIYIFSSQTLVSYSGSPRTYCDDPTGWSQDINGNQYHMSSGHIGSIKSDSEIDVTKNSLLPNTGEFNWTIPSTLLNPDTDYYLVIQFFDSSVNPKSYWLHYTTIRILNDTTAPTVTSVSSTVENGTYGWRCYPNYCNI